MRQVKINPQGIRGTVDEGLDLVEVMDLVSAYADWSGRGSVIVVRDTRPSSAMLRSAVAAALSAAGTEVLDAGIQPTAVGQFAAAQQRAGGLISITGAHNDVTWNGLKLFGQAGRVLTSAEGREVLDLWHQNEFTRARYDRLGPIHELPDIADAYLQQLAAWVDPAPVARARPRVVIDACNGAGAVLARRLCRLYGAELIPLGCEPSGQFPHLPDPTPDNLVQAAAIVRPVGALAGFGLSSDCERLALITEAGRALGRKATLPLVANQELAAPAAARGLVAGATCDSRAGWVAQRHGAVLHRCGVGAQEVIGRILLEGAALGGDNSGGVAVARMHLAYDGLAALALLLTAAVERGGAGALADELPEVHVRTLEVPCPLSRAYSAVARVRELAQGTISDLDGVRVDLPEGWYHVRVSTTEPVIRITCEAQSAEVAADLSERVRLQVRQAIQG